MGRRCCRSSILGCGCLSSALATLSCEQVSFVRSEGSPSVRPSRSHRWRPCLNWRCRGRSCFRQDLVIINKKAPLFVSSPGLTKKKNLWVDSKKKSRRTARRRSVRTKATKKNQKSRLAHAHVASESGFLRIAAALAREGLTASLHQVQIILSK